MTYDKPGKLIEKGAFVMPALAEALPIDPILAALLHGMAFLELSSDDVVDPDWAVEAMEHMAAYLQRLSKDGIANLERSIEAISEHGRANGYPNEFLEFLDGLIENAGLADEEA